MKALIFATAAMALAGCSKPAAQTEPVQIANPASEHCVKAGGEVELRQEAAGTTGYCHLPDGRVVEEWALFRSDAGKDAGKP